MDKVRHILKQSFWYLFSAYLALIAALMFLHNVLVFIVMGIGCVIWGAPWVICYFIQDLWERGKRK